MTNAVCPSKGSLVSKSGTITSGGTAQSLAAANSDRRYLLVQNQSAGDLWIDFGTTAVAAQPSIKIAAGASFTMENNFVCTDSISIIGATTTQAFTAKEG